MMKKSAEICVDKDKKEKWIKSKKDLYSKLLNIPKENIEIFNIRYGIFSNNMHIKGLPLSKDILNKIKSDNEVEILELKNLVEACKISEDMFAPEYDNYENWGINKIR